MIDEIERVLGSIENGLTAETDIKRRFQVVRGPFAKDQTLNVYYTLGLSNFDLALSGYSSIKIELVMLFDPSAYQETLSSLLFNVGDLILSRMECPLRGEVVNLGNTYFPNTDFTAVYVTTPLFLDDTDRSLLSSDNKEVCFLWLVPITTVEAKFVRETGIDVFEDLLDSDLASLLMLPRPAFIA